jgi:hypothetical protein
MSYYNPFQNFELGVGEEYKKVIDRYCQTQPGGGKKPSPKDSPFSRQIDMWFFAFCIGIKHEKNKKIDNFEKIITGEILSRDSGRIQMIETAIISFTSDPYIIKNPREVINLTNEFANYGIKKTIEMLESGHSKPIWNLTDSIMEFKS